jgi:hypothetical protein
MAEALAAAVRTLPVPPEQMHGIRVDGAFLYLEPDDVAELIVQAQESVGSYAAARARFRTLVAVNALRIAQRELESRADDELSPDELAELARRIRAGDVPEGTLELLKRHVAAKLRIASPRYLERYE